MLWGKAQEYSLVLSAVRTITTYLPVCMFDVPKKKKKLCPYQKCDQYVNKHRQLLKGDSLQTLCVSSCVHGLMMVYGDVLYSYW